MNKQWEKEIRQIIKDNTQSDGQGYGFDGEEEVIEKVKSLLSSQLSDLRKKVEEMKPALKHGGNQYEIGFEEALDDVLKLIDEV